MAGRCSDDRWRRSFGVMPFALFFTCIVVVVWGLLNLIVAAIVDTSIAAREDDIASAAKMTAASQESANESFKRICVDMDSDGSGEITVEEFKEFWRTNKELQQHLVVMGVSEREMDGLLRLMDTGGDGKLDAQEFIDEFTQMRTLVVKTHIYYVLRYCQMILDTMWDVKDDVTRMKREVCQSAHCTQGQEHGFNATRPLVLDDCHLALPTTCSSVPELGWYYFGHAPPVEMPALWEQMSPIAAHKAVRAGFSEKDKSARSNEVRNFGVDIPDKIPDCWEPLPRDRVNSGDLWIHKFESRGYPPQTSSRNDVAHENRYDNLKNSTSESLSLRHDYKRCMTNNGRKCHNKPDIPVLMKSGGDVVSRGNTHPAHQGLCDRENREEVGSA